jgi:hypothetical protein
MKFATESGGKGRRWLTRAHNNNGGRPARKYILRPTHRLSMDEPGQRLAGDPRSMNRTVYTYQIKTLSQYPLLIGEIQCRAEQRRLRRAK